MTYVGSKRRIMRHIGPIILRGCRGVIVEPFCGGLNTTKWFIEQGVTVQASDANHYLIALFNAVGQGVTPPFVNKGLYQSVKDFPGAYPDWFVGWVGFGCSFRTCWMGGYADFHVECKNKLRISIQKNAQKLAALRDTVVAARPYCADYADVLPRRKTVYLDPPYAGTADAYAYENKSWDKDQLLKYIEKLKSRDNQVYISEYDMPGEFECVWERQLQSGLANAQRVEKLYSI